MATEDNRLPGRHNRVRINLILVCLLYVFIPTVAIADQPLKEGDWEGKYKEFGDLETQEILYEVDYSEESGSLTILMINLSLEPRSEHTYELSDIKAEGDSLGFKIVKEFETLECSLKKISDMYVGTCSSSVGNAEETNDITMSPPPDQEGAE